MIICTYLHARERKRIGTKARPTGKDADAFRSAQEGGRTVFDQALASLMLWVNIHNTMMESPGSIPIDPISGACAESKTMRELARLTRPGCRGTPNFVR